MNNKFIQLLLWSMCMLLSSALVVRLWLNHRDSEQRMLLSVQNHSDLLSKHVNQVLTDSDLVIQRISGDPRIWRYLTEKGDFSDEKLKAQLTENLGAVLKSMPGAANLFLADAQGRVLVAAIAVPEKSKIADQEHFARLASSLSSESVISQTERSRANGKWSLEMTRRLVTEQGKFLGLVGVSIEIEELLSRFYESVDWPEGTAISLWNQQRRLLMSYPLVPERIGKRSIGNLSGLMDNTAPSGRAEIGPSELDGQICLRAVHKVGLYPLSAIVAVPQEHYFAGWNSELTGLGLSLVIFIIATRLFASLLGWQKSNANFSDQHKRTILVLGLRRQRNAYGASGRRLDA